MLKRGASLAKAGWVAIGLGVVAFVLMMLALVHRDGLSGPNATECNEPGGPPPDCTAAQNMWSDRAGVLITVSLVLLAVGVLLLSVVVLRNAYRRRANRTSERAT